MKSNKQIKGQFQQHWENINEVFFRRMKKRRRASNLKVKSINGTSIKGTVYSYLERTSEKFRFFRLNCMMNFIELLFQLLNFKTVIRYCLN